jgi:outer membrane protein assembly factor BamB
VDAQTGQQQLWSQKPGGNMRARPAAAEGALYAGDRTGNLFGLNASDGTESWTMRVNNNAQILVTPVVLNDYVVVAPFGGNNRLEVYRPNGEFYWAFNPGN